MILATIEQEASQIMTKGQARLILMGAVLFVVCIMLAVIFILWPFAKGTAGLIKTYETGVVERAGRFREDKSINMIKDPVQSGLVSRLFWRMPVLTRVIRVDKRTKPITLEAGNAIVGGYETEFEANGFYRVEDAFKFISTVDIESFTAQQKDGEERSGDAIDAAVRSIAQNTINGALTTALSSDEIEFSSIKKRNPIIIAQLESYVDEVAQTKGLRFEQLQFSKIGVPNSLARDMASTQRARLIGDGTRERFKSLFGQGNEMSEYIALIKSQFPDITDEQARNIALRQIETTTAGLTGGADFVIGN